MNELSVTIITKNEARNIKACLESVSWAAEVVVVDQYSSDETAEIARSIGAKVFQESWHGFARQKNIAVEKARGPWILSLDADERVSNPLREEILRAMAREDGVAGFHIPRKNYFRGKWIRYGGWYPDYTLRLFRKDSGRFAERSVHERVVVQGRTAHLPEPLEHYTYRSVSDFLGRMDRYSLLAAQESSGRRVSSSWTALSLRPLFTFFKMYLWKRGFLDGRDGFFLAASYAYYTFLKYFRIGESEESPEAATRAGRMVPGEPGGSSC